MCFLFGNWMCSFMLKEKHTEHRWHHYWNDIIIDINVGSFAWLLGRARAISTVLCLRILLLLCNRCCCVCPHLSLSSSATKCYGIERLTSSVLLCYVNCKLLDCIPNACKFVASSISRGSLFGMGTSCNLLVDFYSIGNY